MKKIISILLLFCITNLSAYGINFDTSVDEAIRHDYNVEYNPELPALPSVVPTAQENVQVVQTPKYNPTGKMYTIESGTIVVLHSNQKISNWSPKGSIVSFTAQNGFNLKDGTIVPAGTIFKGKVVDSHRPQITGNGGLVSLKIDEIYFNGIKSPIETKISLANSKKVFLGDIKGKRSYWSNCNKSMTFGKRVFKGSKTCASAMSPILVINWFSFIPILFGSVVYTTNLVVAPVISIFRKGGSISLPAGTEFKIKVTSTSEIRG